MRTSHLLLTFMFCWFTSLAFAQIDTEANLQAINQKRQKINRIGMITLGSWAIGNIATAGFSISNAEGSRKHFHQMNLGWGAVNLALAGFGYYSALTEPQLLSLNETVDKHYQIQKILLLNSGLDLAYMASGLYLRERAKNDANRQDMFEGFGNSLILQGGFLFVFDVTLYLIHRTNNPKVQQLLENVQLSYNQIGFVYQF
ncbi:MAG: hypothetical protein ACFB0B_03080 [Thermonemataceae bacterium]